MSTHSCVIAPHLKDSLATADASKYGRMFPDLPGPVTDEAILLKLGRAGSMMDAASRVGGNEAPTERLCEKRSSAFKVRKKNWLSRPKETSFHTVSEVPLAIHYYHLMESVARIIHDQTLLNIALTYQGDM